LHGTISGNIEPTKFSLWDIGKCHVLDIKFYQSAHLSVFCVKFKNILDRTLWDPID